MVTRDDYPNDAVRAAHAVLLELAHVLGEYRDSIVIVGGWAPVLLYPDAPTPHTGSLDVDVALNHRTLREAGYRTIHRLLTLQGYYQKPEPDGQPYQYYRDVPVGGRTIVVEVDFLAGEYGGTTRKHRHQRIQDVQPRKARGCDLAFERPTSVRIEGRLPDGAEDSVTVQVASIAPFLLMKSILLARRDKPKDAWDIYYCLVSYPHGLDALAEEFRQHRGHGLYREGLAALDGKFRSATDYGPSRVADFEGLTDPGERAILQQDAYQRTRYLLERVNLP
jgi:hypothetical protein